MRRTFRFLIALYVLGLASHAAWWVTQDHPRSWDEADWSSAGILPDAASHPEAVVHVLAGRTGRWKGIFAHHTWIVVKPRHGRAYTRFEVVGWGTPVRRNAYAADGRWYSDTPRVLLTLRHDEAERVIPRILDAVAHYPHSGRGNYVIWPGPNSNTFVATIARAVPELSRGLLPTAIGKDFVHWPVYVGTTPSDTGLQVSVGGVFGVSLGVVEGLEINVFSLVVGVDLMRPAFKVPGWGRIGMSPA